MKNSMREEKEDDCFDRLPDDVVLLILNKLSDAKCLLYCSLVSKRVASLLSLLQLNSLSLSLPYTKPSFLKAVPKKILNFLTRPIRRSILGRVDFDIHPFGPKPDTANSFDAMAGFLKRLKEIGYLRVELPFSFDHTGSKFKWYAEFGSKLGFFVMISCDKIYDMTEKQAKEKNDTQEQTGPYDLTYLVDDLMSEGGLVVGAGLAYAVWRHHVLRHHFDYFRTKIRWGAEVRDGKRQGKMRVREEGIGDLWSLETERPKIDLRTEVDAVQVMGTSVCVNALYVPKKLMLSHSRRVMKHVKLVTVRPHEGPKSKKHDMLIAAARAFEEDEGGGAYGEAVREMLAKNPRSMVTAKKTISISDGN